MNDAVGGKTFITENILVNLINFLAPVVAIALIIFCVIQAFKIFKGSEGASFKGMLQGMAVLFVLLGVMYAAGSFEMYGETMRGAVDKLIEGGGKDASNILG